ncbi:MAG: phosphopentomutase [Rhodothermaceae bacterium]|nr:phosphopentomutase [Rhodothermaceae bacterium]
MLFVSIVLDGVGVGDGPDAAAYGDVGSDTLGHVCQVAQPHLPHFARLGLGRIRSLEGVEAVAEPMASWGRLTETAAGKDSTTGHWELAGLILDQPFPTYPDGFPPEVIEAFLRETGVGGVLGNKAASGTAIIAEHGAEHQRTGWPIVYTSADSVFQIAAHVETIPLDELYRLCTAARERVCVGEHTVGRIIARPFESLPRTRSGGAPGNYQRISSARKDFSLAPTGPTVQEALQAAGVRTVAIGKIAALFGGVGFDAEIETKGNADGIAKTLEAIGEAKASGTPTFIWTNLVDFDERYGHRNDPDGFARALEAVDAVLPDLVDVLPDGARLLFTADHGNDPTYPGTDHTRERVPVLLLEKGASGRDLGTRSTYADHAATIAVTFGVDYTGPGTSFG